MESRDVRKQKINAKTYKERRGFRCAASRTASEKLLFARLSRSAKMNEAQGFCARMRARNVPYQWKRTGCASGWIPKFGEGARTWFTSAGCFRTLASVKVFSCDVRGRLACKTSPAWTRGELGLDRLVKARSLTTRLILSGEEGWIKPRRPSSVAIQCLNMFSRVFETAHHQFVYYV